MLDPARIAAAVVGNGPAASRRVEQLKEGGATKLAVFEVPPAAGALDGFDVVYVADLDRVQSEQVAAMAHEAGALVNVEDVIDLCDFHVPGMVRRGDLLLTIATGGKSPGLARALRRYFEAQFGPEWAGRLDELAAKRRQWMNEGADLPTLARRTDAMIEENGWLK
ncbi:MAG: bifunctional precorrin-2 dehydrogenase/sirohydrochlorin ferrochelatase [Alphaproteobacteria bacterium]